MRFKKTVTECLVAFDSTISITIPRGITEVSFKSIQDKFKNQALKDFAARNQVNYPQQNLCNPTGVTIRACTGRLQEIINYLIYFLGHNLNVLFNDGV